MFSRVITLVLVAVSIGSTAAAQERLKPGETFRDCADCPEMVVIPAGSFMMGSPMSDSTGYSDERPQHRVTIPRAFALGKYEVTFAEWPGWSWGRGNRPVMAVSWDDAKAYVRWLARKTGRDYRLPSEAEWEYAARAGTTSRYHWGNSVGRGNANCDGCGSRWDDWRTAPVGSFSANRFGLYDMSGNAWEWVEDCWNDSYRGAPSDGTAWTTGDCGRRVLRGGSRYSSPGFVRAAFRFRYITPGNRVDIFGFRIARTLEPSSPSEKPPKRIARNAPLPHLFDLPKIPVVPPRQPEPKAEPKQEPAPRQKPKPQVHATPAPAPKPPLDAKLYPAGSGFYVSGEGYVVTNEHVVDDCKTLAVWGADKVARPASLIGSVANPDLALLKTDNYPPSFAVFRKGSGARPGDAVAAIGFPLVGYLSATAKITTGIVNADAGPRGDPDMLQFSAPVQPGNSGGPLMDAWGQLIGVVVSRLKEWKVAEVYGRASQNVNFAIKARLVRSLLDAHGVSYRTETATTKLDPAGIYERARPFTVLVGCWKQVPRAAQPATAVPDAELPPNSSGAQPSVGTYPTRHGESDECAKMILGPEGCVERGD